MRRLRSMDAFVTGSQLMLQVRPVNHVTPMEQLKALWKLGTLRPVEAAGVYRLYGRAGQQVAPPLAAPMCTILELSKHTSRPAGVHHTECTVSLRPS